MHKLKELKIWNKALVLTVDIYKATSTFPKEEIYGLTSAVSIPSNISEGAGRNTNGEFKQFLGITHGSSYELQTQIVLSNKLSLLSDELTIELLSKIEEIQKMNYSFKQQLN